MRILIIHPGPDFSVADVFNGWKKAFEKQGHHVVTYNTNERLSFYGQVSMPDFTSEEGPCEHCGRPPMRPAMEKENAVLASTQGMTHELYTTWPQMVFLVSAFYTPAWVLDLVRQRRHKVVILHTESPYQDDEQLMRAQYAHLNLLNDPVNLEEYAQLAPAMYMPHAYDPDVHYPAPSGDREYDFSFVGTMFDSRREFFEEFLSSIDTKKYKIAMGGGGWDGDHMDGSPLLSFLGHPRDECVGNEETARVYRASKVGINFYRRESESIHQGEGWAVGPREVELAACGVPWLRDSRGESDELFPFMPTFSTPGEAVALFKWHLDHEYESRDLARKARAAIQDRTFDNHAAMLMKEMSDFGLI